MGEKGHLIAMITAYGLYAAVLVLNSIWGRPAGRMVGLYHSVTEVSHKYPTLITPVGWSFAIWGLIYSWISAWVLYSMITLWIPTKGGKLYYWPDTLPIQFWWRFSLNSLSVIGWIYAFDKSYSNTIYMIPAGLMLYLSAFTCYGALVSSYRALEESLQDLKALGKNWVIWAIRILVQNGLSVYATWISLASTIGLYMVLYYCVGGIRAEFVAIICLVELTLKIVAYVLLDTFCLDRYTRYTVTPHFTLVWAFNGVVLAHYRPHDSGAAVYSYFELFLLIVSCLAVLEKLILLIVRAEAEIPIRIDGVIVKNGGSTSDAKLLADI